jgi:hypothetical protein
VTSITALAEFFTRKLAEQRDACAKCRKQHGELVGHAKKGQDAPTARVELRLFPAPVPGLSDQALSGIEKGIAPQPPYEPALWMALCQSCRSKQLAARRERAEKIKES